MKRKSVLLKLTREQWEQIKRQEKTLHVDRARPMGVELPVRVLVYLSEDKGVVGEFLAAHFLRRNSVGGLAARSMTPLQELIQLAGGEEVFAWTIEDPGEYERTISLEELEIKRLQRKWVYVEVDDLWPE